MSEFTPLREAVDDLANRSLSPDFGDLKRRASRRGRRRVAAAAAAAVAVIAVGGGLAAGTLGGSDRMSPIGEPTTPSSESPTVQESAESTAPHWPRGSGEHLDAILEQAPSWTYNNTPRGDVRDFVPVNEGPCSGNWTRGAAGVEGDPSKGEVTYTFREVSMQTGVLITGFPSEADASDAAARLVENLGSCTATAWGTQPIAQTGAVLASSADVVAWIQQEGADLIILLEMTTDGPPPAGIQVEVAEWTVAYGNRYSG